MRNRPWLSALASLCALATAPPARAEKLEGILWDVGAQVIVEGVEVVLTESTRIERKGHPGITARELRIGWEVEVQGRPAGRAPGAEKSRSRPSGTRKSTSRGPSSPWVRTPSTSRPCPSGL